MNQPNHIEASDKPRSGLVHRAGRRWLVSGIAMVPVRVEMEVEANEEKHAEKMAQWLFSQDPKKYIESNSEDYASAWDWRPTVTLSPTDELRDRSGSGTPPQNNPS